MSRLKTIERSKVHIGKQGVTSLCVLHLIIPKSEPFCGSRSCGTCLMDHTYLDVKALIDVIERSLNV